MTVVYENCGVWYWGETMDDVDGVNAGGSYIWRTVDGWEITWLVEVERGRFWRMKVWEKELLNKEEVRVWGLHAEIGG